MTCSKLYVPSPHDKKYVAKPARKNPEFHRPDLPRNSHVYAGSKNSVIQFFPYDFDPKTFGMQVGDAELEAVTWNTRTDRVPKNDI